MPQIIITTSGPGDTSPMEVHRERVQPADVETDTSSHLLVERIGWALSDAERIETGRSYEDDATAGFTRHSGTIADTGIL